MGTVHLSKGAPKSTRLDAAAVRKRASTKGDAVVEIKPGEEVVGFTLGWTIDQFVPKNAEVKKKAPAKKSTATKSPQKKAASKKTAPKSRPGKSTKRRK